MELLVRNRRKSNCCGANGCFLVRCFSDSPVETHLLKVESSLKESYILICALELIPVVTDEVTDINEGALVFLADKKPISCFISAQTRSLIGKRDWPENRKMVRVSNEDNVHIETKFFYIPCLET